MKEKKKKPISFAKYFSKHKYAIGTYIMLYLIAGASSVMGTVLFANAVQKVTAGEYFSAINVLLCLIGFMTLKRVCFYFTGIIYNKYSVKIMADINSDIAKQAFKLNSKTYSDHDTGTFVQRIVSDPERVVECFADLVDIITDVLTAVIMLIYISTLNLVVAICVAVMVVVGLILEGFRLKSQRKNRHIMHEEHDKISSLTTEIVGSEKDIKALGLENGLSKVSAKNYDNYRKAMYHYNTTDMNFWASRNLIVEVMGIIMLIIAIWVMNKNPGMITLASFMIIYGNHDRSYLFIWGVGNIATNIVSIKVSCNRMFSLFDEDEFVTEKFGDVNLNKVVGDIEFKNVSYTFKDYEYSYNKKTNKNERKQTGQKQVFNNLSFKIPHNKTVAFVGKSGSGKTTILNLMSKMIETNEGEVLIDGININLLNKQSLRSAVSLVNQFPYIYDMTIKENLLLARQDASDEDIENALKKAYLFDFVSELSGGLDARVGESGIKLSGGQKQRLAIARALLRNSPIILFDESTSALDNIAQNEVKKSIDGLKGSSTIVVVAHRLSTIKDSDIIFFLDDGKIIDQGTFDELFEKNEKFRNLFLAENIEQ